MNKIYQEFRNDVFCRRPENQFRAKLLWSKLKTVIPEEDRFQFETEWSHYILNEHTTDEFAEFFSKHVKMYFEFTVEDMRKSFNRGVRTGSKAGLRVARGGDMRTEDFDEWINKNYE